MELVDIEIKNEKEQYKFLKKQFKHLLKLIKNKQYKGVIAMSSDKTKQCMVVNIYSGIDGYNSLLKGVLDDLHSRPELKELKTMISSTDKDYRKRYGKYFG